MVETQCAVSCGGGERMSRGLGNDESVDGFSSTRSLTPTRISQVSRLLCFLGLENDPSTHTDSHLPDESSHNELLPSTGPRPPSSTPPLLSGTPTTCNRRTPLFLKMALRLQSR